MGDNCVYNLCLLSGLFVQNRSEKMTIKKWEKISGWLTEKQLTGRQKYFLLKSSSVPPKHWCLSTNLLSL